MLVLALPALAQTTRIEIHPIRSVTLTDEQFLNGVKEGKPVTIAGELRLPRPWTDRMPATTRDRPRIEAETPPPTPGLALGVFFF